jgi:glutaconate CoA-transferase subunit B
MQDSGYTPAELMVTAAAREIRDGDVVFVGMRLPLLGFLLAKMTHAPEAVGVYELGIVRTDPAAEPILTMGDLANLCRAQWLADTTDAMALLQNGHVDVSFIGGAQIDRFGNLNTSTIGPMDATETRLPGSGGACDLASLAGRHIIIMAHERRRFVAKVDYITSPGYGNGGQWRRQVGLPGGGPCRVITTRCCMAFAPRTREMVLASVHPGEDVDTVRNHTGWPLRISDAVVQTPPPTPRELAVLRRFDPKGFWTGR